MPFRHPDRSHDLGTRIEMEVRERLEEALDFVCLDALVRRRREQGLPPPAAESLTDRAEYEGYVLLLLRRLAADVRASELPAPGGDDRAGLLGAQVRLARTLPDYWQRFEAVSERFLADRGGADSASTASAASAASGAPSGGERRGLLARLFGRG